MIEKPVEMTRKKVTPHSRKTSRKPHANLTQKQQRTHDLT